MGWVWCLARVAAAAVAGASLSALLLGAKMKLLTRIVCAINGYQLKPGADLRTALLSGASLQGADLDGADLTDANLSKAEYDQNTVWPAGFDPVAAGVIMVNC